MLRKRYWREPEAPGDAANESRLQADRSGVEREPKFSDYWDALKRRQRAQPGLRLQSISVACLLAAAWLRSGPLLPLALIAGIVVFVGPVGFVLWRRRLRRG
jgi:Flp pilus assembly protein TadB